MASLSDRVRWLRFRNSGLAEPFSSVEECARRLAGVQAQILPAAAVAIGNRTRGVSYRDVETALFGRRSLIKLWGQRSTLHLYASTDWPLMYAAQLGRPSWWARRVEKVGRMDGYREALERLAGLAQERGLVSRADLADYGLNLDDPYASWGGAFKDLVLMGIVCHGEQRNGRAYFAHRGYWLPGLEWNPPPADEANAELLKRFFRAYGPATARDAAYWRGMSAGEASRVLDSLADDIVEVEHGTRLLALRDNLPSLDEEPPPAEEWPIRLLYRFDPLLLAHKDKRWLVEPEKYARVWKIAGHIDATILIGGRIAGTWRYDRRGKGLVVTTAPFEPLPPEQEAVVQSLAENVARFFDLPLADYRSLPFLEQAAGITAKETADDQPDLARLDDT